VGRLSAWNTAGSCLGTVAGTLIGYEMDWLLLPVVLALLVWVLQAVADNGRAGPRLLVAVVVGAVALTWDLTGAISGGKARCFFGSDGAIFVYNGKHVVWDGLWHSDLSDGADHRGTRNWYLGVAPLLLHPTGKVRDACIIGLGTGITAATVAQQASVERVVAYDITLTLREVLEAYPEGTLGALTNPKLEIRWEDARMGLALREQERFDLIQAQPLWLKQAGSGLLNSIEFYRLVASRLKPGGVFCLYSNGTPGQAFVARQTAAKVFAHGESFFSGYLLVLSNDPLPWDRARVEEKRARLADDPLWKDFAAVPATATLDAMLGLPDHPRLPWGDGRLISTDDHPRIEHPLWIDTWIEELGYDVELPDPSLAIH
jgi:spermidine synthase